MKILQIASLGLPVSPDLKYGGTERVIGYLDEVYTDMGHDSFVVATGDSKVRGTLIETIPQSLWNLNETSSLTREIVRNQSTTNLHYNKCIEVLLNGEGIDIVHDHPGSGVITAPEFEKVMDQIDIPILMTLHGAFSEKHVGLYKKWVEVLGKAQGIYFNAISQSQRKEFEGIGININGVVYHGIPIDRFGLETDKSDYLFTIGRISPEKGQHLAIEIAKRTGRRLIIAGEVHSVDGAYWKEMIEPHIDGDQINFVGSKTDEEKIPLYQKAAAFIFPLQWREPFGLIMIESMACGTPVVAYDRGSVTEVVRDGETGFVIKETGDKEEDLEAMVRAVNSLDSINPTDCRNHVEEHFSIQIEAENYLSLYEKLINSN